MLFIELKDKYAVKNSKTVKQYMKNDNGMLIMVEDRYYAPLVRDIKVVLKKQVTEITGTYIDAVEDLVVKYHAKIVRVSKTIAY